MRRSGPLTVVPGLLALCGGLAVSCLADEFHRDGAICSTKDTCPPGQECSQAGYCLFPCPVEECVDDTCGCDVIDIADRANPRICKADGLCHIVCTNSCPYSIMVCDSTISECLQYCSENHDCARDAECLDSGGGERVCRLP